MLSKNLFLALIISSFFTLVHGMENCRQDYTNYQENTAYNSTHILNLAPEDVWLPIIACSDTKYKIRELCSYFREYASTRNEKLFLQKPLIIVPEVLERFALYYADFAHDNVFNNLLYHGANPNSADDNKKTLMHYAAQNGNFAMVKTLLEHPAFDKKNITTHCTSPLFLAAQCKHMHIVEYMLSQCTVDYSAMVGFAIAYRLPELVELLLPCASDSDIFMMQYTRQSIERLLLPPLDPWIYEGDRVRPINLFVDVLRPYEKSNEKISALHYAAIQGYINAAQKLISNGTAIDIKDDLGFTPLHYAISCKSNDMINLLIKNKATSNSTNNDLETPLHCATRNNHMTRVLFLLNHGADIDAKNTRQETALQIACAHRNIQIVQLLLAYGADINHKNKDGATLLEYAYNNTHFKIIELLLKQPNIDLKKKDNSCLLSCIILDNNKDMICLYKNIIDPLIKKTDITEIDIHGQSPLSYAIFKKNIPILHKLLAQPNIKINTLHGEGFEKYRFGKAPVTALDIAQLEYNNPATQEIINLLIQHGAKTKAQLENGLLEKI